MLTFWLVSIGAGVWGLTAIGMAIGMNLNVVNILFTQALGIQELEILVYALVGVAGLLDGLGITGGYGWFGDR